MSHVCATGATGEWQAPHVHAELQRAHAIAKVARITLDLCFRTSLQVLLYGSVLSLLSVCYHQTCALGAFARSGTQSAYPCWHSDDHKAERGTKTYLCRDTERERAASHVVSLAGLSRCFSLNNIKQVHQSTRAKNYHWIFSLHF